MALDLSNLSDDALQQMYQAQKTIRGLESNNAPDSSTITSPKGAQGSMQVMPNTAVSPGYGVTPSNGTPEDTAREGRDYLAALTQKYGDPLHAAMAYNWGPGNMDKWLASGADMSKIPDETLKYAYNYVQKTAATPSVAQPAHPSQMTDDQLKAAYAAQQKQPSTDNSLWANIKGGALQAANLAAGGLEALPIGAAAAYQAGENINKGQPINQALGGAAQQAMENFQTLSPENALNKLGVDTSQLHGTTGYAAPAKALDFMFNTVPEYAGQQIARNISHLPGAPNLTPEQQKEMGHEIGQNIQFGAVVAPIAHAIPGGKAVPADLEGKLKTGDWDQPETQPTGTASEWAQTFQNSDQASDLVRAQNAGEAEANLQPTVEQNLQNLREQAAGEQEGIITDAQAALDRETGQMNLFTDPMSKRVADFNQMVQEGHQFTQEDMFDQLEQRRFDQFGPDEQPRALTSDEFQQTMENLASTEGTRFTLPDDPEKAYGKYLDTVSDEQGGLFDRPTIAKNFADLAAREAVDRYVEQHPVVKVNTDNVAAAQMFFDNARDTQTKSMAAAQLKKAQDTLSKSQENIGKFYQGKDGGRFGISADENGIIHMNSGLPIPDWITKGLVRMLQGLHGIVVELGDRAFQKFRNMNSAAKIIQAGMRQAANERNAKLVEVKQNQAAIDLLKKNVPGEGLKSFVPDDRPYEEAKQDLMAAKDMDSSWVTKNITSQGGIWATAISKSPTVKWAYTHIQNALKEADTTARRLLTNSDNGLRTLIQKMDSREKGEIHALMDMDEGDQLRTENDLHQRGFNDKQIAYYKRFHEIMNEVYDRFNARMQAAGFPPVDKRVAYMTSRFIGDFRSLVYQKGTTRPVGFIGGNTSFHVNGIKARLEELHPGKYDFEKTTLNRGAGGRAGTDMFQGYLNVLNHFSLDDPAMKEIMDTYRDYFTSNAAKAMGAMQHAKDKSGVMGFEGRKAWETQEKNAVEGMKSQLVYADHMIKWSALQEAASKVKQMMEDPDINQPNAKSYIKDYMANALGQSTSNFAKGVSSLLDGVAERTGLGPSIWRGMNSGVKSGLLQLWLGFFRLPHALLTLTQFLQSNPAMAEFVRTQGGGNFWTHIYKGLGTTMNLSLKQLNPFHELKGFDKEIWDYNQKNQVFAANLTNHLADVNSTKAGRAFRHIMEANITYPEAAIRSSTFATWAHTLKEEGYSTKDALGTAENLTRATLVDYRPSERPLVFGKMGMMGDIASTLTRFKMNQISQHQFFGKEAIGNKNFTPMAALLASSIAFAGISGLMGFNYADQAYKWFTEYALGKPDTLKAVLLRNMPDWANYGLLAQFGINMQGSFSNADTLPNNTFSTFFPTGSTLTNMVKSAGEAAYYHDDTTMKKLLYQFSPTSIKGIEENQMFSKDQPGGNKLYINPNTEKAQSVRGPGAQMARNLAFHPIAEARENDVIQSAKDINDMYASIRERDLKKIEHQFAQGTTTPEKLASFRNDWVAHRGDASAATEIEGYLKNQVLTDAQRTELAKAQGNVQAKESLQDIFAMHGAKK